MIVEKHHFKVGHTLKVDKVDESSLAISTPNLLRLFESILNGSFAMFNLSIIAFILNTKKSLKINNINFIFLIAILLEFTHFIIPNRAFELYDLLANLAGVLVIFLCRKLIK